MFVCCETLSNKNVRIQIRRIAKYPMKHKNKVALLLYATIGLAVLSYNFLHFRAWLLLLQVSQDGVMRCFDYSRMELVGSFRSYFGGLICVAWSPDGKYVLAGGEDDLVTLWSVAEKRVVARGQGHNSWVNCVQFDPFLCGDGGYR